MAGEKRKGITTHKNGPDRIILKIEQHSERDRLVSTVIESCDNDGEMFAGHYGVSFLINKFEPRSPLWTLFLAAQLPDVLWAVFVLLGIEHYRIVPGITASLPLDLYYIPYTHSLVATWVLSPIGLVRTVSSMIQKH